MTGRCVVLVVRGWYAIWGVRRVMARGGFVWSACGTGRTYFVVLAFLVYPLCSVAYCLVHIAKNKK